MIDRPDDKALLKVMLASEAAKDAAEKYLLMYARERGLPLSTVCMYPSDLGCPRFDMHVSTPEPGRSNKVFVGGSGRRDTYQSPAYGIEQAEKTLAEAADAYKKRYGGK